MAAPKGNKFYKIRTKHGVDKLFSTPEILWEEALNYFEWCQRNPLFETKAFHSSKKVMTTKVPHMRVYTLNGLCLYLNVSPSYIHEMKRRLTNKKKQSRLDKDFVITIDRILETIYTQKYEGAAANMLNAKLIGRDLGLVDKKEIDHTTKGQAITGMVVK